MSWAGQKHAFCPAMISSVHATGKNGVPSALKGQLFDHLVGGGDECLRDGEAERLGGVAINHQRNFGGLLYGEVCRLFAFEDSIDVAGCTSVLVDEIRPVGDQAAAADEQAERAHCG